MHLPVASSVVVSRQRAPHTCQEPHTAALPQGSVEATLPCSCWSVRCSPLPPNPTERCLCNLMLFQKFMQDSFNSCTNPGACLFPTRCDSYSVDTVQRRESSSWRSLEVSWSPVFESKAHLHRLFLHSFRWCFPGCQGDLPRANEVCRFVSCAVFERYVQIHACRGSISILPEGYMQLTLPSCTPYHVLSKSRRRAGPMAAVTCGGKWGNMSGPSDSTPSPSS